MQSGFSLYFDNILFLHTENSIVSLYVGDKLNGMLFGDKIIK